MISTEKKLMVLLKIAKVLNKQNFVWAIGASCMLYLNNITNDFHDIDIMISIDQATQAKEELLKLGVMKESLHGEEYVTKHFYEFVIDDVEIDLIGGFAIRKDGVIYDCSLKKENINKYVLFQKERIPLESLNVWKKYYELMNRVDKVKMIEEYLTKKASLNAL